MLHITQNIDTYTQHANTLHRTLLYTLSGTVINTSTEHAIHYTEHCLTLYSDTTHIVQNIDIDAHYTEHWYKLHRTLMHIV